MGHSNRDELDHSKRIAIYRQLHAVLADDQPYTWTVQVSTKWAIAKRVKLEAALANGPSITL